MEAYVEQVLVPSLRPGPVVVMDNLSAHTGSRIVEVIRARGYEMWFLPSYSSDLSPIEQACAKLKSVECVAASRDRHC